MIEQVIILLILPVAIKTHTIYPEQVHISLGNNPDEMVITWLTFYDTYESVVWYGTLEEGLMRKAVGCKTLFRDDGEYRVIRYVHRVVLQNLTPETYFVYRCGSFYGWSPAYVFKVHPTGTNWSPKLIIFGDMGLEDAVAYPHMLNACMHYQIDALVHVGDIAYNLDMRQGSVGDEYLRMIQPLAAFVPYMTVPGNHEQAYNFSHYKNIFTMPGDSEGLFYSFDLGPAHFIGISTEVYYFLEYGIDPLLNQLNWLKRDLKEATSAKNRKLRPWIIVFGHRPLYCSSDTNEDCSQKTSILRCSILNNVEVGLETLFYKSKVDVNFSGHMHYYERSWPIFGNHVYNGSGKDPYKNPKALIHIITGAAGMKSGTEKVSFVDSQYFAFHSTDYSYTILTVCNRTHLHLEQISASTTGQVLDSFWITKNL